MTNNYRPVITIKNSSIIYSICSNNDIYIINKEPLVIMNGIVEGKIQYTNHNIIQRNKLFSKGVIFIHKIKI